MDTGDTVIALWYILIIGIKAKTPIHKSDDFIVKKQKDNRELLIVFYFIAVNPCELPKSGLLTGSGAASTRDLLPAGNRFSWTEQQS